MRKRSNDRAALFFRNKPATAVSVMALGTTLLALGLPADWIDLAALALAAVTARPAETASSRTAPRKPRRKNRTTRRRTSRGTR
ncbi:hypothetical protein ACIPJG_33405 [Streptomyces halstedii]|uniref:hypothetical protein n=1 Tax=Streptomyces halstedii TaxID=1944 RepID=UPI0038044AC1